ncbi:MAG: hypothetical protein OER21_12760, partial [Gemmatimonadota bacterium]|nr:hypothetical protein [Gemmatimonadota bacterium]
VAAWPYGRYAPDGAATVALRAARVEVVGGPAGVTVRVPAQGRVEGTVTLDSVLLPWAPEDFGWFRAVLRNPTRDTLRVPMEVPPASQGCNVLVEIADPSGVVRVPWQGVTWTCLPSDTTVLTLPPADSTTWTFIWAGTVLRNDSAHPWPVGPAVPAGAWAAHVTVGPADDRYRVGTLAFPMGRPALDQLDRRVWVAQDSVAVGESVELRIGLYNTTDRLLRIWEGDLECVLGVLMVREADGQDVTPSYICFGSSRWRVLQPGDSLVSGGPDWSWEFRATGTRSVPGRYALRYRLGYPSDPPAYLGAPIFVTVY